MDSASKSRPGDGHELQREVPQAVLLLGPDLVVDAAGVVAEAEVAGGLHEVLLALQAGRAGADELLVVVEGQRRRSFFMPVLVFQFFTNDLAWSISLFHSSTDQSPTPPSAPQKWPLKWVPISLPSSHAPRSCFSGVLDALVVGEADVRAARRVLRRLVEVALLLRQHVDAAEEERHVGVVLLGHLAEVREQLLAVLARAVPGEHHELRRLLDRASAARAWAGAAARRCTRWSRRRSAGPRSSGRRGAGCAFCGVLSAAVPGSRAGVRAQPASAAAQAAATVTPTAILWVTAIFRPPSSFAQGSCVERPRQRRQRRTGPQKELVRQADENALITLRE